MIPSLQRGERRAFAVGQADEGTVGDPRQKLGQVTNCRCHRVLCCAIRPAQIGGWRSRYVLTLSVTKDQAAIVFGYAKGFLESSPALRKEIASTTTTEIRLRSGIVISTHAASFRSIRGRTMLAVILDEVALWRQETSAASDIEVYRAVVPALARTKGPLIGISTPYMKSGLLFDKHRKFFSTDDPNVLIVQRQRRCSIRQSTQTLSPPR